MARAIPDALPPVLFGKILGHLGGWMRDLDNRHVGDLSAVVTGFAVPASTLATMDQLPWAASLLFGSMLVICAGNRGTSGIVG